MDLGSVLRAAREEAGLGQRELAQRLGVTIATLSRWETGARPVRADDADRVLTACGRDVRFTLVQRHADTDELLARLAALPVLQRMQATAAAPGIATLQLLQETAAVCFTGAWAAAALGLPALQRVGGFRVGPRAEAQRAVVDVLKAWPPVQVEDGHHWDALWDESVFVRHPSALWHTPVLGHFRIDVGTTARERRVVLDDGEWRVADPHDLVPDHVDAAVVERWSLTAT